jgi:tetratricopeptide (TPR) repeat protein
MRTGAVLTIALTAGILGASCGRRPDSKKSEVVYEMVGTRTIFRPASGAPSSGPGAAPVYAGANLIVPSPGPGAPIPSFDTTEAIPAALPAFVGSAIPGADGRAPQTADKLVLLALLRARRFVDLERCFEDYQTAFELDARKEYWPSDALEAFRTGDAAIGALVNEWAAASPRSWAAIAARGAHRHALAWLVRGSGFANTVLPDAGREFGRQEEAAAADLREAIRRKPRFVAAHYVLLGILRGSPAAKAVLDDALRACPECYQPRSGYLDGLWPEWGGSYERMESFVRESIASNPNPRLRLLRGTVPYARAMKAQQDGRPQEAMALVNEALAAGDHWGFYLLRASASAKLSQPAAALPDLDRAFELRPQAAPLADFRGQVRARLGLLEGAVADFDLARKLDPARPRPEQYAQIADTLVRRSNEARATGSSARADELLALANTLKVVSAAPVEAGSRTPAAEQPAPAPTAVVFTDPAAAFRDQLASLPDDYGAYRRLALPLLNGRRTQDLEELWTVWIGRHPEDPRGYRGRSDAYSQMRDADRRDADLSRACALGDEGACRTRDLNAAIRARAGADR